MSEMSAKMELLNFLIDSFKQAKTLAEENDTLRAGNEALRETLVKVRELARLGMAPEKPVEDNNEWKHQKLAKIATTVTNILNPLTSE